MKIAIYACAGTLYRPYMATSAPHSADIKTILAKHARLSADVSTLNDDSDLYTAGLTSLTTVNLMLALEDHFNVEFPEKMLVRKTFQSIRALSDAVEELRNG